MSDLNTLLEEAVQTGRLDGITIYPSPNWGWQVSVKTKGNDGWNCEMGSDINAVMTKSLANFNRGYRYEPAPKPETDGGVFD